jgi:hypothetical protein
MAKEHPNGRERERMERLIFNLQSAWLEDADADVSNLIDEGLRDPRGFAWALARRVADERVFLWLSVQRALVGAVAPALYGVCAMLRGKTVVLTFYVANTLTEDELEDLRIVGTEVIADFTASFLLEDNFITVADLAEPLPTVGEWVHRQRGLLTN